MRELTEVPAEMRALALARFRLIEPHLNRDRSLQLVAHDAGVSLRTAQRWVTGYRAAGLAALARKPRKDRGALRAVTPKIKEANRRLGPGTATSSGHIDLSPGEGVCGNGGGTRSELQNGP